MTMPAAELGDGAETDLGYASSQEHIDAELRRLDLRIQLALLRRQAEPVQPIHRAPGRLDEPSLRASLAQLDREIELRRLATPGDRFLGVPHLARLFRLGRLEEQLLLACFAPEVDVRYGKLFAQLQDAPGCRLACIALLLDLLCHDAGAKRSARAAFSPQSSLLAYRLLQLVDAAPGHPSPELSSVVRIDARIANALLGISHIDDRLAPYATLQTPQRQGAAAHATGLAARIGSFVRHHLASSATPKALVFHLHGADTAAARAAVTSVCQDLSLALLVADMEKIAAAGTAAADLFWLMGRESVLQPAALCLENFDAWINERDRNAGQRESLFAAVRHFSQLSFLVGRPAWNPGKLRRELVYVDIDFPVPDIKARTSLWEAQTAKRKITAGVDYGQVASRFRFNAEQIGDALDTAANIAYWREPLGQAITADDISEACRAQAVSQVGSLARKMAPKYTWSDLVLPPDHLRQLRELCNQAKHRHIVYGEWGFDRRLVLGNGLNVMFNGPPGTGKTMAADVIANDLQVDTYKIDLSQIVSKYIGETEKNLDHIFREAESSNAIVFFDEADALFGKRSEVKDAHDRYANIETGYLLQKMEEHAGIVILASNLRHNIDEAFLRRMQFVVEFPFPDEEHRARLWSGLFPAEVPRENDVDFAFLARHFRVPGGNIKNIAVCAAFLAAAEGKGVGMRQLIYATRREYQKLGWPCTATDFGPYYELVKAKHA